MGRKFPTESILLILPERVTLVVQYPPLSSCSLLNDVPVTMSHKVAGPLQPQVSLASRLRALRAFQGRQRHRRMLRNCSRLPGRCPASPISLAHAPLLAEFTPRASWGVGGRCRVPGWHLCPPGTAACRPGDSALCPALAGTEHSSCPLLSFAPWLGCSY